MSRGAVGAARSPFRALGADARLDGSVDGNDFGTHESFAGRGGT